MASQMASAMTRIAPAASLSGRWSSATRRAIPSAVGLGRALPARVKVVRRGQVARAGPVAVTASIDPFMDNMGAIYTLAEEVASDKGGGFLGPVVGALEAVLKVIDSGLESANVPYSYGFSIIILTLLVKVVTFPLSKQQVESTMAMQTLQPRIKELQKQYAYDKERLQMETARLYQDAGVNPLAGCLPTLATLPVWIGLYRALTNVANEGLLTDGFFWIPSLAGPTTMADQEGGAGLSWLLPLQDSAPPIGWHDAGAYLVMPVLLIVSQYVSQAIISPPKSDDPSQEQANAILKFLPLMIGWFSLNVPSGLTLYWFTNNILTTGQQIYLRKTTKPTEIPVQMAGGGRVVDVTPTPVGGPGAPADPSVASGETRSERRKRERAEKRGQRFAERKAKEATKKSGDSASESPEVVEGDAQKEESPSA